MNTSDIEIIELIREEGTREKGFDLLVRQYHRKVYWIIRRMVIDHDDADDLAQDAMLKIWKNLGKFRAESGLFTWIYRIAVNEALSFLKKKKLQHIFIINGYDNHLETSLHNDAFFRGDEAQFQFQNAILRLPEKQRLVFNLKYFDELNYEEISRITGTSVGALKASYHHAVKKIQKFITNK